MENDKEVLLVHQAMEAVNLTDSTNIVLSPQFYTYKEEEIPVQYAYQAKRIAPSLFDGLLDDDKTYEYITWKKEDRWCFVAYDMDEIVAFLASRNIATDVIFKIFFMQQLETCLQAPVCLGSKECLVSIEGRIVVVPNMVLSEDEVPTETLSETCLPKHGGLTVKREGGLFFSARQLHLMSGVLIVFALLLIIEGMRYTKADKSADEDLSALLEEHTSLSSSYVRESELEKYTAIDTKERVKRNVIKSVSGMIFKGVTFESMEMNEKKFSILFGCSNVKVCAKVIEIAKKEQFNTSKPKGSSQVKVEGSL